MNAASFSTPAKASAVPRTTPSSFFRERETPLGEAKSIDGSPILLSPLPASRVPTSLSTSSLFGGTTAPSTPQRPGPSSNANSSAAPEDRVQSAIRRAHASTPVESESPVVSFVSNTETGDCGPPHPESSPSASIDLLSKTCLPPPPQLAHDLSSSSSSTIHTLASAVALNSCFCSDDLSSTGRQTLSGPPTVEVAPGQSYPPFAPNALTGASNNFSGGGCTAAASVTSPFNVSLLSVQRAAGVPSSKRRPLYSTAGAGFSMKSSGAPGFASFSQTTKTPPISSNPTRSTSEDSGSAEIAAALPKARADMVEGSLNGQSLGDVLQGGSTADITEHNNDDDVFEPALDYPSVSNAGVGARADVAAADADACIERIDRGQLFMGSAATMAAIAMPPRTAESVSAANTLDICASDVQEPVFLSHAPDIVAALSDEGSVPEVETSASPLPDATRSISGASLRLVCAPEAGFTPWSAEVPLGRYNPAPSEPIVLLHQSLPPENGRHTPSALPTVNCQETMPCKPETGPSRSAARTPSPPRTDSVADSPLSEPLALASSNTVSSFFSATLKVSQKASKQLSTPLQPARMIADSTPGILADETTPRISDISAASRFGHAEAASTSVADLFSSSADTTSMSQLLLQKCPPSNSTPFDLSGRSEFGQPLSSVIAVVNDSLPRSCSEGCICTCSKQFSSPAAHSNYRFISNAHPNEIAVEAHVERRLKVVREKQLQHGDAATPSRPMARFFPFVAAMSSPLICTAPASCLGKSPRHTGGGIATVYKWQIITDSASAFSSVVRNLTDLPAEVTQVIARQLKSLLMPSEEHDFGCNEMTNFLDACTASQRSVHSLMFSLMEAVLVSASISPLSAAMDTSNAARVHGAILNALLRISIEASNGASDGLTEVDADAADSSSAIVAPVSENIFAPPAADANAIVLSSAEHVPLADTMDASPTDSAIPTAVSDAAIPTAVPDAAIPAAVSDSVISTAVSDSVIPTAVSDSVIPTAVSDSVIPTAVYDAATPAAVSDAAVTDSAVFAELSDVVSPCSPIEDHITFSAPAAADAGINVSAADDHDGMASAAGSPTAPLFAAAFVSLSAHSNLASSAPASIFIDASDAHFASTGSTAALNEHERACADLILEGLNREAALVALCLPSAMGLHLEARPPCNSPRQCTLCTSRHGLADYLLTQSLSQEKAGSIADAALSVKLTEVLLSAWQQAIEPESDLTRLLLLRFMCNVLRSVGNKEMELIAQNLLEPSVEQVLSTPLSRKDIPNESSSFASKLDRLPRWRQLLTVVWAQLRVLGGPICCKLIQDIAHASGSGMIDASTTCSIMHAFLSPPREAAEDAAAGSEFEHMPSIQAAVVFAANNVVASVARNLLRIWVCVDHPSEHFLLAEATVHTQAAAALFARVSHDVHRDDLSRSLLDLSELLLTRAGKLVLQSRIQAHPPSNSTGRGGIRGSDRSNWWIVAAGVCRMATALQLIFHSSECASKGHCGFSPELIELETLLRGGERPVILPSRAVLTVRDGTLISTGKLNGSLAPTAATVCFEVPLRASQPSLSATTALARAADSYASLPPTQGWQKDRVSVTQNASPPAEVSSFQPSPMMPVGFSPGQSRIQPACASATGVCPKQEGHTRSSEAQAAAPSLTYPDKVAPAAVAPQTHPAPSHQAAAATTKATVGATSVLGTLMTSFFRRNSRDAAVQEAAPSSALDAKPYYDEARKRWIFPGDEDAAEPASAAPPPSTGSFYASLGNGAGSIGSEHAVAPAIAARPPRSGMRYVDTLNPGSKEGRGAPAAAAAVLGTAGSGTGKRSIAAGIALFVPAPPAADQGAQHSGTSAFSEPLALEQPPADVAGRSTPAGVPSTAASAEQQESIASVGAVPVSEASAAASSLQDDIDSWHAKVAMLAPWDSIDSLGPPPPHVAAALGLAAQPEGAHQPCEVTPSSETPAGAASTPHAQPPTGERGAVFGPAPADSAPLPQMATAGTAVDTSPVVVAAAAAACISTSSSFGVGAGGAWASGPQQAAAAQDDFF